MTFLQRVYITIHKFGVRKMLRRLSDYRGIVSDAKISEIHRKSRKLYKKHILHISSTPYGGGVAEILRSIIPLFNDMGLYVGWRTMIGSPDFFRVTKKFHNALQGDDITITHKKTELYEDTNKLFSRFTHIDHDLVVIHDPQPLPIIACYRKRQPWIWRCHIDLSRPHRKLWNYMKGFILSYDMVVYQMEEFAAHGIPGDFKVIKPSIDPLSMKNMELPKSTIKKYVKRTGVDVKRPLITQISRFDKWKDTEGVIKVFDIIRKEMDCQLLLVGDIALDDPEAQAMYERVLSIVKGSKDVRVILGAHDVMVNAIQRASDVVLQKSIREGFGLTVSEALWKGTPVVASKVGGIPAQVVDGINGYLVRPNDYVGTAKKVMDILSDKNMRKEMGRNAKRHVKENFLVTRHIEEWIDLWVEMLSW